MASRIAVSPNRVLPAAGEGYLLESLDDVQEVSDEAIADKFPKFKVETAELRKMIADTKRKPSQSQAKAKPKPSQSQAKAKPKPSQSQARSP